MIDSWAALEHDSAERPAFLGKASGGPAKKRTSVKAEEILTFDWSRDGRSLAFVRGVKTSDVVLIEEGQK